MIVASISTATAVPNPTSLMKIICDVTNAPIAIENSSAAAVTIRPVRSSPIATASAPSAAVARLLDPRQQEDAVVGREPERDREQQQRLRRLEPALARVAEQALEAPVLEDQHEDSERRAEAEQVHHQLLDRQHHRAGHQEQHDDRDHGDDREHERQVLDEAVLEVDVVRR